MTKRMIFLLIALSCAGIILLVCCFFEAEQNKARIDVQEEDGRFVIWKENEYYQTNGDLSFVCRRGKITNVMISYDNGKHYQDGMDLIKIDKYRRRVIIPRKLSAASPVCLKLITKDFFQTKETRNYRIKNDESKIVSEISDPDTSFDTQNMIN